MFPLRELTDRKDVRGKMLTIMFDYFGQRRPRDNKREMAWDRSVNYELDL